MLQLPTPEDVSGQQQDSERRRRYVHQEGGHGAGGRDVGSKTSREALIAGIPASALPPAAGQRIRGARNKVQGSRDKDSEVRKSLHSGAGRRLLDESEPAVSEFDLANITVRAVVYTMTNNQAGNFRRTLLGIMSRRQQQSTLIQAIVGLGGSQFSTIDRIDLNIPANAQLTGEEKCSSHYDCLAGHFCASWGTCDACGFCEVDAWDAIDGRCPRDTCPNSGGFPKCLDGQLLADMVQPCPNVYDLEVWRYTEKTADSDTGELRYVAPRVIPAAQPKPRFVTPQNRMVGAFVLTQVRA